MATTSQRTWQGRTIERDPDSTVNAWLLSCEHCGDEVQFDTEDDALTGVVEHRCTVSA